MNSSIDYAKLESWCQDAISILAATGVPEKLVRMQRHAVSINSGKKPLFQIADDLAIGLNDLPDEDRLRAQHELVSAHGFGFDFFVQKKLKKVKAIMKRGKVKSDDEYYDLADFAADSMNDPALISAADLLMSGYKQKPE